MTYCNMQIKNFDALCYAYSALENWQTWESRQYAIIYYQNAERAGIVFG